MAEEKKNNQLDDVVYKKALREVVQEFKQAGEVRYSELTKRVSPLDLTSEQINDLRLRKRKKSFQKATFPHLPGLKSTILSECI